MNPDDGRAWIVMLVVIGVAAGLFLAWAMPALWHLLRPLIHALTA